MSDSFGSTKTVRARKQHKCEECWRTIEAGELYYRHAGVWEGDFFTNVSCAHCAELRRQIAVTDCDFNEVYYGGAGEWVLNTGWQEVPERHRLVLCRLSACFKARWRFQSGNLMPIPDVTP